MLRICLLLLLCLPNAWGEEGSLPTGWRAEKIESGDEERVFYSLYPADGREAQVITGAVYERLLAGEITAEAAYRAKAHVPKFLGKGETIQGNMVMPDPIYSTAVSDSQPDSYKQGLNKPTEAAATPTQAGGQFGFAPISTSSPEQPGKYSASGASSMPGSGVAAGGAAASPSFPGVPGNASGGAVAGSSGSGAASAGNHNSAVTQNSSANNGVGINAAQGTVNSPGTVSANRNLNQFGSRAGSQTGGTVGSTSAGTTNGRVAGSPSQGCASGNGSTPGACNYNVGDRPETYSAAIDQAAGDAGAWVGGIAGGYMPKTTPVQPTQPPPK